MDLSIREIYLPIDTACREDKVLPLDWQGRPLTLDAIHSFLGEHLTRSTAYRVRLEAPDGSVIGERDVWDALRERLDIGGVNGRR